MSLVGPTPWISHEMLMGPPRPSATGVRPWRSGLRSQMAVGNAGWVRVSAMVGNGATFAAGVSTGAVVDAMLAWGVTG